MGENTEPSEVLPPDRKHGPSGPAGPRGRTGLTGPPGRTGLTGVSWKTRILVVGLLFLLVVLGAGNLLSGYIQNQHSKQQSAQQQARFEQQFTQQQARFEQQFTQQQEQQAAAQRKASEEFEAQLCAIFLPIARLKAPVGSPVDNPSRAFEQQLEAKLALIAPVLRCK